MDNKKIEELLERVRDWGCSCDIMNDYSCGHSAIIGELRKALTATNETTPPPIN